MANYNYYLTQRPPSIGTHPRRNLVSILAYDTKVYIPRIECKAWGLVVYSEPLIGEEIVEYELLVDMDGGC